MKKRYALLALLLFPLNVLAVSGGIRYEYKIIGGSSIEVTLKATVNSGTLNKYSADLAFSDNITFKEATNEAGWNITFSDGKVIAVNETGITASATIGKLVLIREPRTQWSVTASNSELCEGDSCVAIYNNKISGTPSSSTNGTIPNPNTAILSSVGLVCAAGVGIAINQSTKKKKRFKQI